MNIDRTRFYTKTKKAIISLKLNNAEHTGGVPKKGRFTGERRGVAWKAWRFSGVIMNEMFTHMHYSVGVESLRPD